jgi:uncharacterized repeat protein (TIGR01451 family)
MFPKDRSSPGQALIEFAFVIGIVLMFILIILESVRYLQAWQTVQNAAQEGGRYVLTRRFDPYHCLNTSCSNDPRNAARVYAIRQKMRDSAQAPAKIPHSPLRIDNLAVAFATETVDPDMSNNTRTEYVAVLPTSADLSISKVAPPLVAVNGVLTYSLYVGNNGPLTATAVTVVDLLPRSVNFLSAATSRGSCSHADYVVTCTGLGPLGVEAMERITITVRPVQPTYILNTAHVSGPDFDHDPENNYAYAITEVRPSSLSMSSDQPEGEAALGQTITYSVQVQNTGNVTATAVTVTGTVNGVDLLMAGPSTIGLEETGTYYLHYTLAGVECDPGLTFLALVRSGEGITLSSEEPVITAVICPPPTLLINLDAPAGQATPGASITYTIHVTNTSAWLANGIVVTATINGIAVNATGPATIAANGVAHYQLAYSVTDNSCAAGLSALAAVSSANGSWATLPAPVLTPVTCVYRVFTPLVGRP